MYRYHAVIMRARFDENKDIQDLRVAKELIAKAEEELFLKQHWHPRKCRWSIVVRFGIVTQFFAVPESPGGVAYLREVKVPDWMLDHWHPLEKAQYPEYFARREQRKQEYLKNWEKKYGKSLGTSHH